MDYLETLNPKQREAVLATEGPLLIVAGAGTGKTKTLTHRIYHLIHQGVHPGNILAITFTNKAAKEMRERVFHMLQSDRGGNVALAHDHRRSPHDGGYSQRSEDPARSGSAASENFQGRARGYGVTESPTLCTFHSLGVRILRRFFREANLKKTFTILDTTDTMKLVKEAMELLQINPKLHEPKKIRNFISGKKSDGISAESFSKAVHSSFTEIVSAVWTKYEELKSQESGVDFDDLLLKTLELLERNLEVRKTLQNEWKYIHIDEYQDTNRVQYDIVRLLAESHHNLCVVGDTDQNIYSWRGANLRNILNFERDYPESQTILLEENYRSSKNILTAADEVIKKNTARIHKELRTSQGDGEKINLFCAMNEGDEARHIAGEAKRMIDSGTTATEIAVLYRTNFQSRVLEEAFLRAMVPYQLLGTKFFERKEIKDVVAYIRAAFNRDGLSDIKRIINEPKRGLGPAAVAKIFAGMAEDLSPTQKSNYYQFEKILNGIVEFSQHHTPSEVVRFTIERSGFFDLYRVGSEDEQERLENLEELVTFALKYDDIQNSEVSEEASQNSQRSEDQGREGHDVRPERPSATSESSDLLPSGLAAMLEDISLQSDQDELSNDRKKEGVKLMTIHASKGLEFNHVFIGGLEQGLFPHEGFDEKKSVEDQEEERRLFYVALTRARKQLHLSYAMMRTIYGNQQFNEPSEFLTDIPEEIMSKSDGFGGSGTPEPIKTVYLDW